MNECKLKCHYVLNIYTFLMSKNIEVLKNKLRKHLLLILT